MDLAIAWRGETLGLLPERALHLADRGVLLVADAHFGKAAVFRAAGVPVPRGTTTDTLARLDAALERTGATHLVFLGDFLHGRSGRDPETLAVLAAWRSRRAALAVTVIRGNHDRHAGDPPPSLAVSVVPDALVLGPFVCRHEPEPDPRGYVLAGHLHPAIVLRGRAAERLRLPCFHLGAAVAVLPAFGAFTGMAGIDPGPGDRVFAVADDSVIEVPRA